MEIKIHGRVNTIRNHGKLIKTEGGIINPSWCILPRLEKDMIRNETMASVGKSCVSNSPSSKVAIRSIGCIGRSNSLHTKERRKSTR